LTAPRDSTAAKPAESRRAADQSAEVDKARRRRTGPAGKRRNCGRTVRRTGEPELTP